MRKVRRGEGEPPAWGDRMSARTAMPVATRKAADNDSQPMTAFCVFAVLAVSPAEAVAAGLPGIDSRAEVIPFLRSDRFVCGRS